MATMTFKANLAPDTSTRELGSNTAQWIIKAASVTVGNTNTAGVTSLYDTNNHKANISTTSTFSANRDFYLPDKSGVLALEDDISDILVKQTETSNTDTSNYSILLSATTSPISGNAYESLYNNNITINPKEEMLTAKKLNGYVMAGQLTGSILGNKATTEGEDTTASATAAHAEGYQTTASGQYSHAEGQETNARSCGGHAEGYQTFVSNTGVYAHAEGANTQALNQMDHAEGYLTTASGGMSHAEGRETQALEIESHVEGYLSIASGTASHAEGYATTASGIASHAEGRNTKASALGAHAEGGGTVASEYIAHAEGYATTASNTASHAEGWQAIASGNVAHSEGRGTIAQRAYQHVFGQYNIADTVGTTATTGQYVEIVGNGTSSARSNARTLDWSGNEWLAGNITISGAAKIVTGTSTSVTLTLPSATGTLALAGDIDDTYIKRSGDTMTGNLTMSGETAIISKTTRKRTGVKGWAFTPLYCIGNDDSDFAHIGILGTGDTLSYMYIGANNYDATTNLRIYPSGKVTVGAFSIGGADSGAVSQTIESNSTMYVKRGSNKSLIFQLGDTENARFNTSGHFIPGATNTYDIGTSSLTWKDVYATTFHGALNGNADTASALTVNAGSTTCPVYFTDGVPTECTNLTASAFSTSAGSAYRPIYINANGAPTQVLANSVLTNLESTAGASIYAASPRPGVTGVLPITNGGTGNTTGNAASADKLTVTNVGSTTCPVYFNSSGKPATCTNLTASAFSTSAGSATLPIYINSSGNPTSCSTTLAVSITGSATSAAKLTTSAGSPTIPIYIKNTGEPAACYTATTALQIIATTANSIHPRLFGIWDYNKGHTGELTTFDLASNALFLLPSSINVVGLTATSIDVTTLTATNINVTTLTATTQLTTAKLKVTGATTMTGVVRITKSTNSTATSNGALVVTGGIGCGGNIYASAVWGAVWNDYAEMRNIPEVYRNAQIKDQVNFHNVPMAGHCVVEVGDDTMTLSAERLQRGCKIISDTFGFNIGETDDAKIPVAVSGRVLVYCYEGREEARKHIGYGVCSGPDGTVSIMTEEEERMYPMQCLGIISAVPDYEIWGDNISVNGRIWIYVK